MLEYQNESLKIVGTIQFKKPIKSVTVGKLNEIQVLFEDGTGKTILDVK